MTRRERIAMAICAVGQGYPCGARPYQMPSQPELDCGCGRWTLHLAQARAALGAIDEGEPPMHVTGGQHIPHPDDAAGQQMPLHPAIVPAGVQNQLGSSDPDYAHQAKLRAIAAAIAAENRAQELVEALTDAVAGAPQWRPRAAELLRRISRGEMKPPKGSQD